MRFNFASFQDFYTNLPIIYSRHDRDLYSSVDSNSVTEYILGIKVSAVNTQKGVTKCSHCELSAAGQIANTEENIEITRESR